MRTQLHLGSYLVSAALLWTFAVGCTVWWDLRQQRDNVDNSARIAAKALCEKYVLSINRASMTGDVHEMEREEQGRWGHVTSLKPINPTNVPDSWEAECLRAFETGLAERDSVEVFNGEPYLRHMAPLTAEERCLACHTGQGYSKGSRIGGISVSVPLDPYLAAASAQGRTAASGYGIVWVAGLLGIGLGGRSLRKGIAENERSQIALRQSEERLRDVTFSMADWVWEVDENGVYVYSSQKDMDLLGRSREEIIGRTPFDFMSADEAERVASIFSEIAARKAPIKDLENWGIGKNGERICLLTNGVPLLDEAGNLRGYRGVDKDITERKRLEEAFRQSEERHRALFSSSRDAIMTLEPPSWQFTSGNPACITMFGVKDEKELTAHGPKDLSPEYQPGGRPSGELAKEMIETAMREGSRFFEWTHRRIGGKEFPATVLLARVEIGGHAFLQATVRDITKQKQTEETLRASEEKFRQIVDNIGLGIAMIGTDMRILELNRQMRTWFPNIAVEAHPVCYRAYNTPPLESPCSYCPTIQTLRDGKVHEAVTATPQEGGTRNYRIVSSPIHDPEGRVVAAIEMVEDRTDKVRLERELNQAQKLEAVGRLAAGIAHEINTPIQYVGDNIEFLQIAYESLSAMTNVLRRIAENSSGDAPAPSLMAAARDLIENSNLDYLTEQIPKAIEQSIEGVGRVSTIVQAMKEFSHPGSTAKSHADLNQCIQSTIMVSRNEWKYVADIELDLEPSLPHVLCVASEINQVILLMIVNAAQAIADVIDANAEEKRTIAIRTRQDGDWAVIEVADTGSGIPEEIRERIFDPFFTTKEVGRGTGQGLSIARNIIVDKHGGTISVASEIAKGTTFTIRLLIKGSDRDGGSLSSDRQVG